MTFAVPAWILWLGMSNLAIAFIEYTYRAGNYQTFISALPYIIIPILIGQLGLFNGFAKADNLMLAGALFSLINIVFRIGVTYYLGEELNLVNWLGVVLLIGSVILLKVKI